VEFESGWVDNVRRDVQSQLEAYFERKRKQVMHVSQPALELVNSLAELTLRGGKRVRPLVLVGGYRAFTKTSGALPDFIGRAACALELLQSYLLIHDDWMDQDLTRRGAPTLHAKWAKQFADDHLGASLAVLAGDLSCSYAWELMLATAEQGLTALQIFHHMQEEVVFGQQLDLLQHPDTQQVQQLKTGSYTVRGPLMIGAVLAGASSTQLQVVEGCAEPLGEAFQLCDDLLGTFGREEKTGKPVGSDLRRGKHTAIIEHAQILIPEHKRATLSAVFAHANASHAGVESAIQLLVDAGVKSAVEQQVRDLRQQALDVIARSNLPQDGLSYLRQVVDLLVQRET